MEFIKEYEKRLFEAKLHPMSIIVLSKLTSLNIKHHILSASHQNLLNSHMKFYGLDNYYANSKLNEGIKLIEKINDDLKNILFIGDTKHDFDVATTIGIDYLLISHGHHSYSRLSKITNQIITNMKNIIN